MPRCGFWKRGAFFTMIIRFLIEKGPGAPFIYYGNELGMRYLEGIRSVEGGYHRTGARSPMQWDGSLNAGFSRAKPEDLYIPIDPEPSRPTAENQMARADLRLRGAGANTTK